MIFCSLKMIYSCIVFCLLFLFWACTLFGVLRALWIYGLLSDTNFKKVSITVLSNISLVLFFSFSFFWYSHYRSCFNFCSCPTDPGYSVLFSLFTFAFQFWQLLLKCPQIQRCLPQPCQKLMSLSKPFFIPVTVLLISCISSFPLLGFSSLFYTACLFLNAAYFSHLNRGCFKFLIS